MQITFVRTDFQVSAKFPLVALHENKNGAKRGRCSEQCYPLFIGKL